MGSAHITPAPAPDPEPVPDPAPVPDPEPVPDPAPAPAPAVAPRRRAGRAAALIAVAAVLGVVGGTAVGYGIQAEREPTPLPALNQPGLAYPAKPLPKGEEPEPLPAAADRGLKTDGDLRKLLLPQPKGTRPSPFVPKDGWLSLASYAEDYERPSDAFAYLLGDDVRRIAATAWRTGEFRFTQINLVQFRSGSGLNAADHATDLRSSVADRAGYGQPIDGSAEGRTFLLPVARKAGYMDPYEARAVFHRGDVLVEIFVTDTKKISQKEISSLAERQLERL